MSALHEQIYRIRGIASVSWLLHQPVCNLLPYEPFINFLQFIYGLRLYVTCVADTYALNEQHIGLRREYDMRPPSQSPLGSVEKMNAHSVDVKFCGRTQTLKASDDGAKDSD
jgi:hypothetical protein